MESDTFTFLEAPAAPAKPAPVPVDRSAIEAYSECPMMGYAIEVLKLVTDTTDTEAGSDGHKCLAKGIWEFTQGGERPYDFWKEEAAKLPPYAKAGIVPALWEISQWLKQRNPADVIRFSGGEGDKSGQLGWDYCGVRVTSEVDVLVATPSDTALEEIDFKTGRVEYSVTDIWESFQFQLHAWLVMKVYAECEALLVRAWNTRLNRLSPAVTFYRQDTVAFEGQLIRALQARDGAIRAKKREEIETRPGTERCGRCPAALKECPRLAVSKGMGPVEAQAALVADPAGFLQDTIALEAALEARHDAMKLAVTALGHDIQANGMAYGCNKPKTERRTFALYEVPADVPAGADDSPADAGEKLKDDLAALVEAPAPSKKARKK